MLFVTSPHFITGPWARNSCLHVSLFSWLYFGLAVFGAAVVCFLFYFEFFKFVFFLSLVLSVSFSLVRESTKLGG